MLSNPFFIKRSGGTADQFLGGERGAKVKEEVARKMEVN